MPTGVKRASSVIHHPDILDGRPGFRLHGGWGYVSVLEGGGHICELVLHALGVVNPLWRPTWRTIDPSGYKPRKHLRIYGPLPEGRLLAGIAGHSISFDYFGPPSPEEIAAGHSTHGEAPVVNWHKQLTRQTPQATLVYGAQLPQAEMRLQRVISLDRDNPVVYCEETAFNLATFDRPISWNHHVTFGPPFLEPNVTLFDMPATRSKACPATFSKKMAIRPDSNFRWPNAPRKQGGFLNLRTSEKGRYGHYTAHLLNPALKSAFIAVCNPRLRLLVLYVFNRNDFPWVGNWEESHNRVHAPWNGREFCRGFEFSTTPFPIPRRGTVTNGALFGESTYRWLPARSMAKSKYMIVLFDVPQDFTGVASVVLKDIARRENLSRTTLGHIKHFLSGAFRYARRQGVLENPNPMHDVEIPEARPAGETHAYSLEEEAQMLAILPEPTATVVATAVFTGARKGEIRGFTWQNYDGPEIRVEKSVWRSHVDEPKRPKSKGAIPVIAQLKLLLDQHWERCGRPHNGFIFSNELGNPMNLEALAVDVIRPALEKANLAWHGWHAFRRGLATNLHRLGVSDKVIQQILRHANVSTTMNIYVKMVSVDAANAMRTLETMCATTVQPERLGSTRIM